jgi:perosamine synthetase
MGTPIPLCIPALRGNELAYLRECVETNWVSYVGPFVSRFEEKLAEGVGARYAVATSSGTAALHTALIVAGIEAGDEVLVSDLTFIASANAIHYVGAFPVLMDATPDTWEMDPQKVTDFVERECRVAQGRLVNRATGRPVTALMPVHILGHAVDMDPLLDLAQRYHLRLIEDATESIGAKYKGRMVGNLGEAGCFSFNGNKVITTGGGGVLLTNNEAWARRAKHLTTQAKASDAEYIHDEVGYNYRLTNLQAAVGLAQLEDLAKNLAAKRTIASRYAETLGSVSGLTLPAEAPWAFNTYWLYTVRVDEQRFGMDSRALMRTLAEADIQTRPLWAPLHQQAPYRDRQAYRIEITPQLYRECLSLPSSVGLPAADQQRVVDAIRAAHRPA